VPVRPSLATRAPPQRSGLLENEDASSAKARIALPIRNLDITGMRRTIFTTLFLFAALALAPALSQAAHTTSYAAASESRVLVLLNDIRQEHGLAALTPSSALRGAAREHSSDMLDHGYFRHDSPTQTFGSRIRHYVASPLVGENIAWGTGSYGTPDGLVSLWMHSPEHRRIILMASLHRVGLGIATGTFKGVPGAVMATADFAA
jgi:uncharacterized protein YkwD